MIKRIFTFCILVLAALSLFNCSTLFNNKPQKVTVNSEPMEAKIVIKANTGQVFYDGQSPAEVELPRKNTYVIEVTLDGYKQQVLSISQGIQGWFWGNILCGGLIGMVIDAATGNMWELNPTQFSVKLKTAMIQTDEGPAIVFFTKDDTDQLRYVVVPFIKL